MGMLRSLNELRGYRVEATDGDIGQVKEFYFDDARWTVRYLVVHLGGWLPGRRVLIAPVALKEPQWRTRTFPLAITKRQIESSPAVDTDKPVARQDQMLLHRHYGWELYWAAEAMIGDPSLTAAAAAGARPVNQGGKGRNPNLRTTAVVGGMHLQAKDGRIGHIADFIADDTLWLIQYLVIDTGGWLPGRSVLLAPEWIESIDWRKSTAYVGHSRAEVEDSPPFDATSPVNRKYEEQLYDYYGRPTYWPQ